MAFIDFIGVTIRIPKRHAENPQGWVSGLLLHWLGVETEFKETGGGWSGYKVRVNVEGAGLFAYGGNGDTAHIELSGAGCSAVKDWAELADDLDELTRGGVCGKITRLDIAHDDLTGQMYNINWARAQYEADGFYSGRGCRPGARLIDDMGTKKGKTFYVGSRDSGKLLRIYEKGREQGNPDSEWVRVECEWRCTHRDLTTDMLRRPGHYLAGAYPALSELDQETSVALTRAYSAAANLDRMKESAKRQAGRAIHALLLLTQGDIGRVFELLHIPELPKRCARLVKDLMAIKTEEDHRLTARAPDWAHKSSYTEFRLIQKTATADTAWWRDSELAKALISHRENYAPGTVLA